MRTKNQRRFETHFKPKGPVLGLAPDHFSVTQSRTLFPKSIRTPRRSDTLFITGHYNRKIGRKVEVGRWKGYPIFVLSLEERATCPRDCYHWLTCYGNGMPFAARFEAGEALEQVIPYHLDKLIEKYGNLVIRLHGLGDFYSVKYTRLWENLLHDRLKLNLYGYTARKSTDAIGSMIEAMNWNYEDRCKIRFSTAKARMGFDEAVTYTNPLPKGTFLCPAQRRDDKFCANCAACWESDHNVAFMTHGRSGMMRGAVKP